MGTARSCVPGLANPACAGSAPDVEDQDELFTAILSQWLQFYSPRRLEFVWDTLGLDNGRLAAAVEALIDAEQLVSGLLIANDEQDSLCDTKTMKLCSGFRGRRPYPPSPPWISRSCSPFLPCGKVLSPRNPNPSRWALAKSRATRLLPGSGRTLGNGDFSGAPKALRSFLAGLHHASKRSSLDRGAEPGAEPAQAGFAKRGTKNPAVPGRSSSPSSRTWIFFRKAPDRSRPCLPRSRRESPGPPSLGLARRARRRLSRFFVWYGPLLK